MKALDHHCWGQAFFFTLNIESLSWANDTLYLLTLKCMAYLKLSRFQNVWKMDYIKTALLVLTNDCQFYVNPSVEFYVNSLFIYLFSNVFLYLACSHWEPRTWMNSSTVVLAWGVAIVTHTWREALLGLLGLWMLMEPFERETSRAAAGKGPGLIWHGYGPQSAAFEQRSLSHI